MSANNYNNIFSNSNTGATKNKAATKTTLNTETNKKTNGDKSHTSIGKRLIVIIVILLVIYLLYNIVRNLQDKYSDSPIILGKTRQGDTSTLPIKAYMFRDPEDGQYGTEFTYTVWLYVKDSNFVQPTTKQQCSGEKAYKHIFHKGSSIEGVQLGNGGNYPLLQSPGLWLYPDINKLAINMNTYASPKETCDIGNIPINKWFHLSIMLIGNSIDIYINCNLKKRCRLKGVPKLNYGDFFITSWGGFQGFISNIRYFNYAINTYQIENQCTIRPSAPEFISPDNTPPYLADDYWMNTGFPRSVTQ